MSEAPKDISSRREFLKNSSRLAAGASVLAGTSIPHVHAAEDNTIKIALVGCGGRGTGAASNALSTTSGPIKLVAMADVFDHRLDTSYNSLKKIHGDKVDVPDSQKFIGFDGYEKAISCLGPGDVVLLVTLPHSAGFTSVTPSKKASMSSWKNRSPSTVPVPARCLSLAKSLLRRTSRLASV